MNIIEPSCEILDEINPHLIMHKLELCGRTAYKSEDKMTPDSSRKFIRNIIKSGHESVIEHVSLSIRFICDRGVTHELVRHRLVAYTQESTRYCNYSKKGMTFIKPVFWADIDLNEKNYVEWMSHMRECERSYDALIAHGATPQEARSVLPNSLKTEIIATANLREWRHILKLRTAPTAHPQMRQLMIPLLKELKEKLPEVFEDIDV